jgi:hypothetical protein
VSTRYATGKLKLRKEKKGGRPQGREAQLKKTGRNQLGWEFRCLVPIFGTLIGSGTLILFLILEIPVSFF